MVVLPLRVCVVVALCTLWCASCGDGDRPAEKAEAIFAAPAPAAEAGAGPGARAPGPEPAGVPARRPAEAGEAAPIPPASDGPGPGDGPPDATQPAGPQQDAGVDAGPVEAGQPTVTEPAFHVFLLLGQSNMEGYPKAQAADRVEDERVRVLGYDDCNITGRRRNEWDVAAPPLHSCWNDGLGPGDYFAKTLVEVMPAGDTIGLVPCAINGERIETFLKAGGSRYDWIVERARLAQDAGGVIAGIIFHQGESNNGDPSWPAKVKTLVDDLKSDLGLGPIPFIAGELLYSGSGARHNPLVNMLPTLIENAAVVSAEGLVVDPSDSQWRLHFSHDSVVTQGMRYGDAMVEALGW